MILGAVAETFFFFVGGASDEYGAQDFKPWWLTPGRGAAADRRLRAMRREIGLLPAEVEEIIAEAVDAVADEPVALLTEIATFERIAPYQSAFTRTLEPIRVDTKLIQAHVDAIWRDEIARRLAERMEDDEEVLLLLLA